MAWFSLCSGLVVPLQLDFVGQVHSRRLPLVRDAGVGRGGQGGEGRRATFFRVKLHQSSAAHQASPGPTATGARYPEERRILRALGARFRRPGRGVVMGQQGHGTGRLRSIGAYTLLDQVGAGGLASQWLPLR